MNGAVIKTLREGETAVCDCCGAELTARVIVARAGNFGQSCWKTIKAAASTVRIATKSGNVARVEDVLSRNAKRAEHIKAVAA